MLELPSPPPAPASPHRWENKGPKEGTVAGSKATQIINDKNEILTLIFYLT